MKVLKIVLGVIICLIIIGTMIYANYGGFSKLNFQINKEGGETLVYQEMSGPYNQSGQVISKISYDLKTNFKIEPNRTFGTYLDDPRKVEKSKLRSEVGCILEDADTSRVYWIKANFNVKVCPVKNYITAEFPYKGRMSIMIGLMKVYPALMKYVKANGYSDEGPIMEIYDMTNNKIYYRKEAIKIVK
jgi:effector-binding domain-containing protein